MTTNLRLVALQGHRRRKKVTHAKVLLNYTITDKESCDFSSSNNIQQTVGFVLCATKLNMSLLRAFTPHAIVSPIFCHYPIPFLQRSLTKKICFS